MFDTFLATTSYSYLCANDAFTNHNDYPFLLEVYNMALNCLDPIEPLIQYKIMYTHSAKYINYPLWSVLIQKSGGGGDHGYLAIGCEVVLF